MLDFERYHSTVQRLLFSLQSLGHCVGDDDPQVRGCFNHAKMQETAALLRANGLDGSGIERQVRMTPGKPETEEVRPGVHKHTWPGPKN